MATDFDSVMRRFEFRPKDRRFHSRGEAERLWSKLIKDLDALDHDYRSEPLFNEVRDAFFHYVLDLGTQTRFDSDEEERAPETKSLGSKLRDLFGSGAGSVEDEPEPTSLPSTSSGTGTPDLDPRIFLEPPPGYALTGKEEERDFRRVCGPESISRSDGVFLVGGVRGSGKSRLVDMLERAYRETYDAQVSNSKDSNSTPNADQPAPLWLRFDLGQEFDASNFLRNVIQAISEKARSRYYRDKRTYRFRILSLRFASFARSNVGWAIAALFFIGFVTMPAFIQGVDPRLLPPDSSLIWRPAYWVSSELDIFLFGPNLLQGVVSTAWALSWLVGIAAISSERGLGRTLRFGPFAALLGIWVYVSLFGLREDHWALIVVVTAGTVIGSTAALTSSPTPRWYELMEHLDTLAARMRSHSATGAAIPVPYLSEFLSQLLPKRFTEPMEHLSLPFLEEETGELLYRTVQVFGRVAFIIDDLDKLPVSQFHLALRTLRPLAKARGVVTVLAVPEQFYPAYMQTAPNDLHSTAEDFFFLGRPSLFEMNSNGLPELREKLTYDDVVNSFFAHVWWNDRAWGKETSANWFHSPLVSELREVWGIPSMRTAAAIPIPTYHVLRHVLDDLGGSYREVARLTRQLLRQPTLDLATYWIGRRQSQKALHEANASFAARASLLGAGRGGSK